MKLPRLPWTLMAWLVTGIIASTAYATPSGLATRDGLRVKIDSFITDAFPVVEALITLDAPEKLDYRYLNADTVGLIEEEVPVRQLRVTPFAPPLSLSIVLDDSGSLERDLSFLKESMHHFIRELDDRDEAAVVSFNRGVQVLQPLTRSKPALQRAAGTLTAYGATALFDGLVAGVGQIHRAQGKRTMLVITDGSDEVYPGGRHLSRHSLDQAIELARSAEVEVYVIGLGTRVDHAMLATLAEQTGGFYWYAPSPRYLKPVFDAVTRSFRGRVRITWESPRAVFDRRDRTIVLDVKAQGYHGRDVATYWLRHRAPTESVSVTRRETEDSGLSRLRLFTWGVNELPLEMEFFLYDQRGLLTRHGITTEDGFGRLHRSTVPQLTDIPPGTYRLILRRRGTELDFDHRFVHLAPSETLTKNLGFSKLTFQRESRPWFDLRHDYGDTADLIRVRIHDLERDHQIYKGRLVDFRENRETAAWLQQGAYRITLENRWPIVPETTRQAAVLRNTLDAEIHVRGGRQLTFDVARHDFLSNDDVSSREYLLAQAHQSPFRGPTPLDTHETAEATRQQAERYRQRSFDSYRLQSANDKDLLYSFTSDEERGHLIEEHHRDRRPERLQRERTSRISQRHQRYEKPYHNPTLNELYPDISVRDRSHRYAPPVPATDDPGVDAMLIPFEPRPVVRRNDPTLKTADQLLDMHQALDTPTIDPATPSRAEELRLRVREILQHREAPTEATSHETQLSIPGRASTPES